MDKLNQQMERARWIAGQIRSKATHPAVVMSGLSEALGALADYVVDTEERLQAMEAERAVLRRAAGLTL